MAKSFLSAVVLIGAVTAAFVSQTSEFCRFLPENDQYISVEQASSYAGLTEQDFNAVLDRIEAMFKPEIEALGGELVINRLWENGTVNASAQRQAGKFIINMYGGLARHETITSDGFALVACHEMGHHVGGAPKIKRIVMSWASNEGESDYYATLKCLRRYFAQDNNEKIVASMDIPALAKSTCEQQFSNHTDQLLCMRGAMAGFSVSSLFVSMRNGATIDFGTPDTKEVRKTNHAHPAAQCRLDTYFAGAACPVPVSEGLSQTDFKQGSCHDANVTPVGLRPRCWFQPQPSWWERWKNRKKGGSVDQPNDEIVNGVLSPEIF